MRENVIHEPEQELLIRRRLEEHDGCSLRAAGAVLWRRGPAGTEVGLVHRPKYDDWTFPKGKPKVGEHILRTAVREVREETGITPRLGRRLPATRYVKNGRVKQVEYWAATGVDGADFVPNEEIDWLRWLPITDAADLLSYERDVRLLDEFGAHPRQTVPVIILRHASAGSKRDWTGADSLRPLDSAGRLQATELPDLLAAYATEPIRLVSSVAARCVETLIPYASTHDSTVTAEPAFTVDGAAACLDPDLARARLVELLVDEQPTIVCTHGELVEHLIAELCDRFSGVPPTDPGLPKAGFWVAHIGVHESGSLSLSGLERHAS